MTKWLYLSIRNWNNMKIPDCNCTIDTHDYLKLLSNNWETELEERKDFTSCSIDNIIEIVERDAAGDIVFYSLLEE